MINKGIVQKSENGFLTVVFDRPEACGECHACNRGSESCAKHTVIIEGTANPGDTVEVRIDDSHIVMASALAYLIPLAGLILGLIAANFISKNELVMAACAFCGVAAGYGVMRAMNPVFSKNRWQPELVSVTNNHNKEGGN